MPIDKTAKIWMDGKLVDWDDARIHVLTHTLHYGSGVFEGIRAYPTASGPAVFRLTDHMRRLLQSAHFFMMEVPFTLEELVDATKETIRVNQVESCYIRPIAFLGYGEMGLNPLLSPVNVSIAVWPWGTYLGDEALKHGVRMKVSSWRRMDPNVNPVAATTGTAAEIVPMRSVDDREIGEPGEITRKIQEIYFATVHGEVPQYKEWLEYARE